MTNFKAIVGAVAVCALATPAFANSSVSVSAYSSGNSSASGSLSAGVSANGKSFVSGSVSATGNARVTASATAGNKTISFNKGPIVTTNTVQPTFSLFDISTWNPPVFDWDAFVVRMKSVFGR